MNQKPLESPEAAALLKDQAALRKLLGSPETRKLIAMLQSQQGKNLQEAAEQAQAGDTSGLKSMLDGILSSPEGAALVGKIGQNLKK